MNKVLRWIMFAGLGVCITGFVGCGDATGSSQGNNDVRLDSSSVNVNSIGEAESETVSNETVSSEDSASDFKGSKDTLMESSLNSANRGNKDNQNDYKSEANKPETNKSGDYIGSGAIWTLVDDDKGDGMVSVYNKDKEHVAYMGSAVRLTTSPIKFVAYRGPGTHVSKDTVAVFERTNIQGSLYTITTSNAVFSLIDNGVKIEKNGKTYLCEAYDEINWGVNDSNGDYQYRLEYGYDKKYNTKVDVYEESKGALTYDDIMIVASMMMHSYFLD